MNFLEQLAAEWYQHEGYFVRTNVMFGRRPNGGWKGEMDVIAYDPATQKFLHIETSTDALAFVKRKEIFERKFSDARMHYLEVFPFKTINIEPKQIVVVGFNLTPIPEVANWKSSAPDGSPWGDIKIEVIHIPKFIQQITAKLKDKNLQRAAIPETYPLLRAIQYAMFYASRNS